MDRKQKRNQAFRLASLCLLGSLSGCVANPVQVPTVWDQLGIPQAAARLRDGTINRSGNFPKLEKKPPVLKLADPANLQPEKPEMIKTAAKIKQDQDLKKQKLKAIKFLAEVNCGCYNKDDAVAKAFLAALEDCDPDVRKAGIEGLCTAAGNCSKCRNGCETTCCTEEILKKVEDIAHGCTDQGCPKEPVKEIRTLAAALLKKCPCPPAKPIEEIPAPEPTEVEEVPAPGEDRFSPEGSGKPEKDNLFSPEGSGARLETPNRGVPVRGVSFRLEDNLLPTPIDAEPVVVASRFTPKPSTNVDVANPSELLSATLISSDEGTGLLEVQLSDQYVLSNGWKMIVVGSNGNHILGRIVKSSGNRLTLSTESNTAARFLEGSSLKIGRVKE